MFKKVKRPSLINKLNEWIDGYLTYPAPMDREELRNFLRQVRAQLMDYEKENIENVLDTSQDDFKQQVKDEAQKVANKLNAKNKS